MMPPSLALVLLSSAVSDTFGSVAATSSRVLALLLATGVRNLRPLTLEPRERFNVFCDDNGRGETNLLEELEHRTPRRVDHAAAASEQVAAQELGAKLGSDRPDQRRHPPRGLRAVAI